jgi:hypothetical protein
MAHQQAHIIAMLNGLSMVAPETVKEAALWLYMPSKLLSYTPLKII